MERLCGLFNTSCCVCASINAAHRPSAEKITLRAAQNFSRRCKNPRRTRLFDDSDFLALAIGKRRPRRASGRKSCRQDARNASVKPVKNFFPQKLARKAPTAGI
jgi:hypothetical protein